MCFAAFIPLSIRTFVHDLHNPGDVYACYRVFFLVAFCTGIIPFQFFSQPIRHLRNTVLGYLNIAARIVFYCVVFFYSMSNEQSLLAHFYITDVSRLTDSFQKFHDMYAILTVLTLGLIKRKSLMSLMQQYEWLELHFSRIGVHFTQKKCAWKINSLIFCMFFANFLFIVYGIFIVFERNGIYLSWIAISSFYSPHIIFSSVVVIFYTALHKITIYLRAFNKVIKY